MNNINNLKQNNIQDKNISKNNEVKQEISEKIKIILDKQGNINENYKSRIKELIKREIPKQIRNLGLETTYPIINSEYYLNKFETYFEIHQNFFWKYYEKGLQQYISDHNDYKNYTKNFISKYLYTIFIFSEKVDITILEKCLNRNLEDLQNEYSSKLENLKILGQQEIEIDKKIEKILTNDLRNISKKETSSDEEIQLASKNHIELKKFLEKNHFLPEMYAQIFREISLNEKNEKQEEIGTKISEKFKENFEKTFKELNYSLKAWKNNGYYDEEYFNKIGKEILKKIEIILQKLINSMLFLKSQHIAFTDFPILNIEQNNFKQYLINYFFKENKDNLLLQEFVQIILSENKEEKLEKFISNLKEKEKETINKSKPKIDEDLEAKDANILNWGNVSEDKKLNYFFHEIIGNNGNLEIQKKLKLDENKKELFKKFLASKFKQNENFEETIDTQFQKILTEEKNNISIKNFIEKDVNNLFFLHYLFIFNLILKTLEKENKEITEENILEYNEKYISYGLTEKIFKEINKEEIYNSIFLIPKGEITNTSVKNLKIILDNIILGIKKGHINLNNAYIKLHTGETKLFKDLPKLYFNEKIDKKNDNLEEAEKYINNNIDNLKSILNGHYLTKNNEEIEKILNYLQEKNIISSKTPNSEELDQIQEISKYLKFVKKRLDSINKMIGNANTDFETLQKLSIKDGEKTLKIQDFFKNNELDGFGGKKSFNRALQKLINSYGGNLNKLGDLTRLRISRKNLQDLTRDIRKFLEFCNLDEITHISIIDKTGEPISISEKKSGYRDLKLILKMKTGGLVEVQFLCEDMLAVKETGIKLNENILSKIKEEKVNLSDEEIKEIKQIFKNRGIETNDEKEFFNVTILGKNSVLKEETVSTDKIYHLRRHLIGEQYKNINQKLERIERILADYAWSKILVNYLQEKNINIGK